MREIKFRAWDERVSNMITWKEICDGVFTFNDLKFDFVKWMQFTGLYDNTKWEDLPQYEQQLFRISLGTEFGEEAKKKWMGKEIYEGDIVKGNDFKGVIVFLSYGWFVHRFDANGEVEEDFPVGDYKIEVIGNKFDDVNVVSGEEVKNGKS